MPTATAAPTNTAIPPTATPVPLPAFSDLALPEDFIFEASDPGCELPCWQGLTVNTSTSSDVKLQVQRILGLQDYDVFKYNQRPSNGNETQLRLLWNVEEVGSSFGIEFTIDGSNDVLRVLKVGWAYSRFESSVSVERVLQELGIPSLILIGVYPSGGEVGVSLAIYYQAEEILFLYGSDAAINQDEDTYQLCLDQFGDQGYMQIGQEIEDSLTLSNELASDEYVGIPINDLVSRVLNGEQVCITKPIP